MSIINYQNDMGGFHVTGLYLLLNIAGHKRYY